MRLDFVSLVPAGDDPAAQVVISKAAPDNNNGGDMGNELISKADLPQDAQDYIDGLEDAVETLTKSEQDLQAENETLTKALEEAEAGSTVVKSEDEQFEALLSKADPALQVILKRQRDETEALRKQAEEDRSARLDTEFVTVAKSLPMLNDNPNDLGGLLRRVHDGVSKEDFDALSTLFTAANAQIAKGNLFDEFGRQSGAETTVSKSVDAAAAELRKAEPSLTIDQAKAKVYETNPDLFAQAMTEGR
jgi:hypothetical protein